MSKGTFPHHGHATPQLLIDEKISHLEECIRRLKSERNGLAPISVLPPEILARIFFFALAGRTRTWLRSVLPNYYFSHVSRSWRSIALDSPILWQVLPQRIQWATAMLERSKGADLVVSASYVDQSSLNFLTEVLTKHTSRIRELDLSGFRVSPLFKKLQPSSLRLRSLKLTFFTENGGDHFPTGVVDTTNLRTLSVINYSGSWCPLSLPALTHLKIHNNPNRPSLNQFLEMLRGIAALDVLDMVDSLPSANNHAGLIEPIKLPLTHLCLASTRDYKEVTNILSVITVPRTATLQFRVTYEQSATIQELEIILNGFASSLTTFFGRHTDLSYRNLHVISKERHLCLKAWKVDGCIPATPDLELDLNTIHHTVLRPICPSIPVFDITTLTLDTGFNHTSLKDTFGQLPRLQNVTVVGDSTPHFIQALTSKPKQYNRKHSAYYSVSFPALQFFWIKDFSFKESGACTVEDLQDCLMERYEREAELWKLKLTECRELWWDGVASLRDIVSDVEWDEWEESDESDENDDSCEDDSDGSSNGYYSDDYYYSW